MRVLSKSEVLAVAGRGAGRNTVHLIADISHLGKERLDMLQSGVSGISQGLGNRDFRSLGVGAIL